MLAVADDQVVQRARLDRQTRLATPRAQQLLGGEAVDDPGQVGIGPIEQRSDGRNGLAPVLQGLDELPEGRGAGWALERQQDVKEGTVMPGGPAVGTPPRFFHLEVEDRTAATKVTHQKSHTVV